MLLAKTRWMRKRICERKTANRRRRLKTLFSSITRIRNHRPFSRFRSRHCLRSPKTFVCRNPPTLDRYCLLRHSATKTIRSISTKSWNLPTKRWNSNSVDTSDWSTAPGPCSCPRRLRTVCRCIRPRHPHSMQPNSAWHHLLASPRLQCMFISTVLLAVRVLDEPPLMRHGYVGSVLLVARDWKVSSHANWSRRNASPQTFAQFLLMFTNSSSRISRVAPIGWGGLNSSLHSTLYGQEIEFWFIQQEEWRQKKLNSKPNPYYYIFRFPCYSRL